MPAARINLIQKYIGGFHGHPQLSRLGSGSWEKQKAKVAEAVMDMAAELIEIQAAREAEPGHGVSARHRLAARVRGRVSRTSRRRTSSPAAEEIKQDMQKPRPMDRLLCGDVGYGKTELAMRAAFKAVEYGKQVAVLVPTTVLAEQHYRIVQGADGGLPVRRSSRSAASNRPSEQKEIVKQLRRGRGRHPHRHAPAAQQGREVHGPGPGRHRRRAALRRDAQRAAEAAAQDGRRADDVGHADPAHAAHVACSACATSQLADHRAAGPAQRRDRGDAATTSSAIKLAILRELQREGQVYFVHNRVHNIQEIADEIQQMVPDARIVIGHGQMGEGELEEVMLKFIRHEADILVCTTIIESGPRHPQRQHDLHQQRRPLRPDRAAPAPRPRRAVEAPGVLLPAAARRTGR